MKPPSSHALIPLCASAVLMLGVAGAHDAHHRDVITASGYRLTGEAAAAELEAAANRLSASAEPESSAATKGWEPVVYAPPAGNGTLLAASFAPFKPYVRYYWDSTYFYAEGDSMPPPGLMPTPMVGITAWQQQLPIPVGYFGNVTNPETDTASLGYGKPNVWRIPLVPVPAAAPISLTGNFLRGAVAIGANGIPIFNPRNNTGQFSQAIGELDSYGGHCGRADDYHYHIAPVHLYSVLSPDKPCAWALDGYPIYGYLEPDGTAQQALDGDGGHTHGTWGYHYHARGTAATGPQSPYLMNAMHGTVVNYGGQIDPQPTASSIAPAGSPLAGAAITGFARPSKDSYVLTYTVGGASYNVAYSINRIAHTVTVNTQSPTNPTGTSATYTNASRFSYYPMSGPSMAKLPDTGQTLNATATAGEDSDYTINAPTFTDNGNSTVTDAVTGLMWQKTDSGEMTWENAVAGAASITLGGFSDWRLPTAQEAFSILNHNSNPALNSTYFVNHASGTPGYWWTSDLFYGDNTKAWATNAGGGLGPHPKTSTISAGGTLRFHARYVRGANPTLGHNYLNNGDGTITDLDTGLMWTQAPSTAMSWSNSLTYAEGLTLGGFNDWRLPNVKELQSLQDITRATASAVTTVPCLNRMLFPAATATAYWSSTSVKAGTPTNAWLVDFGVTTTATPSRNQQGIVSYEPYAATYPVFAVRTAELSVSRSISQGLATTNTTNLYPAGQRVSGVGTSTATDATTRTVPAATQFTTATKASDLYNETTNVTPANIAAVNLANVPIITVDADGEVITGYLFADNYFELYVNGTLVAVDPVPYTPFNSCVVKFRAKRPITYAVKLVDWEENLGIGSELNGGSAYHAGDGGFMASFSDGTVTGPAWKAQSFYIAPLNDPAFVVEQPNGTHDSSAAGLLTPTLNQNSYALHYAVPANWYAKAFSDAGWPAATTYTEAIVGVNDKPAYTNFPAQFSNSGAQFIWSSNLVLDNEVIVRYTGPATTQQIAVEQPSAAPLTDGSSTVAYGSVNVGSTLSQTFVIRNSSATNALSITGVTIDGTNGSQFTVTTSPASSIAASGSTTLVVQFAPTTAGAKTAAIHIASSDASVGAAFDINLSGTGAVAPPTITNPRTSPNTQTYADNVWVTAQLAAASGATINTAQLTYSDGTQTTSTVFAETMANVATAGTAGWDGTGANFPWSITSSGGDTKQTIAANRGTGNICGLEFGKGATNPTATMAATTNAINASGTAGTIQFWAATSNLVAGLGWNFQLSTDGTAWTTRLSEATGVNHVHQINSYTLQASERVGKLRMRFQFIGNGTGGPTGPKAQFDDITVVTTTGAPPTTVTMFDDGLHGDGIAGDGVFGAQIPVQTAGKTITYSLSVTDSNGSTTTSAAAASYIVSAITPPANFTATATRSGNNVIIQWPTQAGISYSVQTSDNLINWTNIPVGQVGTWTDTGAILTTPKRFYRVMR